MPLFIFSAIEIQFATYTFLIRDRLEIINAILQKLIKQNEKDRKSILQKYLTVPNTPLITTSKDTIDKVSIKKRWTTSIMHNYSMDNIHLKKNKNVIQLIQLESIYRSLEKAASKIDSSFGPQIIIILIMKFATLTSLLYFHAMILIR